MHARYEEFGFIRETAEAYALWLNEEYGTDVTGFSLLMTLLGLIFALLIFAITIIEEVCIFTRAIPRKLNFFVKQF